MYTFKQCLFEWNSPIAPGPSCKKMVDLSPQKTFIAAAFEPSDEELDDHARAGRGRRRDKGYTQSKDIKMRPPTTDFDIDISSSDSDSDDEFPELKDIFSGLNTTKVRVSLCVLLQDTNTRRRAKTRSERSTTTPILNKMWGLHLHAKRGTTVTVPKSSKQRMAHPMR